MAGWILAAVVVIISGVLIWKARQESVQVNQQPERIVNNRQQNAHSTILSTKTETGPMVYYANDNHGSADKEYRFNYKKVNGSWRAYILRMPSLGNRSSDGHATHRLWDGSKPYACWDSPVNSLSDMQTISRVWADNIQEYIATGKRFG